jgi:uncharacterized lipoprotein
MTPRRLLPLLMLAMATLSGCGSVKLFEARCVRPEDYAQVVDNPPLQIPAGLQGPDPRNAVRVPPLNEPERKRGADEPCLDAPPRFSAPKETRPAA